MTEFSKCPSDMATQVEDIFTSAALAAQRAKAAPQQVPNPDGTYPITECVDCDDEIVPDRLKLGRIRCVYCQEKLEKTYAKR